ncbi:MAG: hypothetical protein V3U54_10470 [Thermodesulfobacteriota bacterium]
MEVKHNSKIMKNTGFDYSRLGYKEMFANYGLVSLKAQAIEKSLATLIIAINHIGNYKINPLKFRAILNQEDKRTMGKLIQDLRQKMSIPSDLEKELDEVLGKRNYLIHHFFTSKGLDIGKTNQIPLMNKEIIEIGNRFQATIKKLDEVMEQVQNILAIPMEQIDKEAKNLFKL